MNRSRFLPALVLTGGLIAAAGAFAQPVVPGQPIPGGPGGPGPDASVPILPKSAGAFVTLKVSALADHPDLKPILAELAKQPDALAGVTEALGVSPLEMDRLTLFWPRLNAGGRADGILVVTTRAPFNEARVLKALKAEPVFDGRGGGGARWRASGALKPSVKYAPAQAAPGVSEPKENFLPPKGGLPEPKPPVFNPKDFFEQPPLKPLPPLPPPPPPFEKKQDDPCAPTADAGPSDPLFYAMDRGPFEMLFLIDEHTLVFLPSRSDDGFSNMALLAATLKKNATGPLADAITAAGKHTLAAGVHLTPLFREFDRNLPQELVPYTALLAARTATLTGDLDKSAQFTVTLNFDDAAAAKRAAPVLEEGVAAVTEKVGGLAKELKESRRPMEKAVLPLISTFAAGLKKTAVKADGPAVVATTEIDAGPVVAKALGDMLQAVQSHKKAEARTNNLKQIGIALHAYHDTFGKFPANVYGPKGELLLSWRVQLLPFLEEDNLYKQFNMNEPWDGPTNKALIEKMPKVFAAPDREHAKGKTFYQAFVGPAPGKPPPKGIIFGRPWLAEGDKNGIRITDIVDGTSNTIAVIEAREGVIWSKPDDLPFGGAVPPLGEKGWDRTPALRFDGSTFLIPTNLKPEEFWPFVTINGGEIVPDFDEDRGPFGSGGRKFQPAAGAEKQAVPATGPEVLPGNPVPAKAKEGPGKFRGVRNLEQEVAELTVTLENERARAALAEATLERTLRAFQAGAVAAIEVDKAKAVVAEANVRIAERTAQLQQSKVALEKAKQDAPPRK